MGIVKEWKIFFSLPRLLSWKEHSVCQQLPVNISLNFQQIIYARNGYNLPAEPKSNVLKCKAALFVEILLSSCSDICRLVTRPDGTDFEKS